jgi:hypothetical protein
MKAETVERAEAVFCGKVGEWIEIIRQFKPHIRGGDRKLDAMIPCGSYCKRVKEAGCEWLGQAGCVFNK